MINFTDAVKSVHDNTPLVHCITNFVTVNDCANIILAAGGSPTMSHNILEVEEIVSGADALVCNMGTIDDEKAMLLAARRANQLLKPIVLDPVAVGASMLRRSIAKNLLSEIKFSVIRGNASEIRTLSAGQASGSGVDVSTADIIKENNLAAEVDKVRRYAKSIDTVIVVSGAIDIISDGEQSMILRNGSPTMARITGSGCMLTSLIAAFCGAMPRNIFAAACSATAVLGVAGQIAERRRLENKTGNATYRNDLIDAVFNMTDDVLMEEIRYEIF